MKPASFTSALKRIILNGCAIYTVLTLLLYTGGMLFSTIEREWIPTISMMYMVLAFSILFSAANYTVTRTKLPALLKLLIHFAVTTLIFYVTFLLWGGFAESGSLVLTVLLCYTLVYAIFSIVLFAAKSMRSTAKNNETAYTSQFSKK